MWFSENLAWEPERQNWWPWGACKNLSELSFFVCKIRATIPIYVSL